MTKNGNKTDNGVHEIGTNEIVSSYQNDTPGQAVEEYLSQIAVVQEEQKEKKKKHFSQVFDNPLVGFPYNEEFTVTEIKEEVLAEGMSKLLSPAQQKGILKKWNEPEGSTFADNVYSNAKIANKKDFIVTSHPVKDGDYYLSLLGNAPDGKEDKPLIKANTNMNADIRKICAKWKKVASQHSNPAGMCYLEIEKDLCDNKYNSFAASDTMVRDVVWGMVEDLMGTKIITEGITIEGGETIEEMKTQKFNKLAFVGKKVKRGRIAEGISEEVVSESAEMVIHTDDAVQSNLVVKMASKHGLKSKKTKISWSGKDGVVVSGDSNKLKKFMSAVEKMSEGLLEEDYKKVIKMYPSDKDWKKLITKHRRAIDDFRNNVRDLPKKVEDELLTWASQTGEVSGKHDAEDFILSILDEKFSPYSDKQYPRCVDFYIQFRGGKGDRITSPENKKDFEKATKMIDAYCKSNKIKQKPVYSTPEEGSSAYKVGLMIDKTYSKTSDYDDGKDLQPLYVALSKLKTAEDHGGGWSQAVVKEDEVEEGKDKIKYRGNLKGLMDSTMKEETITEAKNLMPAIQKIVDDKGAAKVGGVMIDMFTASVLTQAYAKVNDSNKKKMESSNIQTLVKLAQRVMGMKEGKMDGQKLTGQEISVYFRKNRVNDKTTKKAVEIALDHGGAMSYAIKQIEKLKKCLSKNKDVKKALQFANENFRHKLPMVEVVFKEDIISEEVQDITVDPKNKKFSSPADQNYHGMEIAKQARRFGMKSAVMGKHVRI